MITKKTLKNSSLLIISLSFKVMASYNTPCGLQHNHVVTEDLAQHKAGVSIAIINGRGIDNANMAVHGLPVPENITDSSLLNVESKGGVIQGISLGRRFCLTCNSTKRVLKSIIHHS